MSQINVPRQLPIRPRSAGYFTQRLPRTGSFSAKTPTSDIKLFAKTQDASQALLSADANIAEFEKEFQNEIDEIRESMRSSRMTSLKLLDSHVSANHRLTQDVKSLAGDVMMFASSDLINPNAPVIRRTAADALLPHHHQQGSQCPYYSSPDKYACHDLRLCCCPDCGLAEYDCVCKYFSGGSYGETVDRPSSAVFTQYC
jgi:hypothetical protein